MDNLSRDVCKVSMSHPALRCGNSNSRSALTIRNWKTFP